MNKQMLSELKKRFNTEIDDEKLIRICVSAIYFNTFDKIEGLTKEAIVVDEFLKETIKLYLSK